MSTFDHVDVALGERSYKIVIGEDLLGQAPELLAPVLERDAVFIVTDRNLADRHLPTLHKALDGAGISHRTFTLPPGEKTKDFDHLQRLLNAMLDEGVERSDIVVALGGGVIGDLTGFASAILRRGVDFVQIPTTLLAQVDSSVGGKTGIDTRQGKNLVGAFHQPRLVIADLGLLKTLPPRELRAGYAETVKYGLLGDAEFFAWLETNGQAVVNGDIQALHHAVKTSCRAKADVVARDETEAGARALLNLGHTFGHALETEASFSDALLHGEAVALGMVMAFEFSAKMGLCSDDDAARVRRHLADVGLPVHPSEIDGIAWDAERITAHMMQDKKVKDGQLTFVLVKGIGQAFLSRDVDLIDMNGYLADRLANPDGSS